MITSTTFFNGTLTIAIQGRIDSQMVNTLQGEINDAIEQYRNELTTLVLDAEDMTYISSLGLRIILQLRKDWPDMRVINCSPDVYSVFKMTGFTRLFTVTKALPRISDEELQPVEGLDNIFRLSEETMVKVFPKGTPLEEVEQKVQLTREVFIWGVPTVMSFDIVRAKDSYALIFESITQKDIDAVTLGELMRRLHQHIIEPDEKIPSAIEKERQWVKSKQAEYGDERTAMMLRVLNTIPDGSALLHGNITMRDIAFSQEGNTPVVINMHLAFGNPVIDITHLYSSMPATMQTDYFDTFLHTYYNNESESAIERIKLNIITLSKAYRYYEEGVMDHWDEIFSDLHFKMDFAEKVRELERERFYLNSEVNIDWVASALGTNRHYVSDYFNKVLHTTFTEYINTLRLDHAASLLRSGRVPQSQISYSSGFNSDHTFRRLFKQKFGCTPSQFIGGGN